jgi:hypothetical protein
VQDLAASSPHPACEAAEKVSVYGTGRGDFLVNA